MSAPLVLSLFPGIGLLDMAFEEEGFCVVRGPDLLWGGDVRRFHPPAGKFDGVIGGPPCQAFSRMRHMVEAQGFKVAENLIPEFERIADEARPDWWVMENVPAAPIPSVDGYYTHAILLRDVWCGGETSRERRFTLGTPRRGLRLDVPGEALHRVDTEHAVTAGRPYSAVPVKLCHGGRVKKGIEKRRTFRDVCRLQGLPEDFDLPPFTSSAKGHAVGNGVPLPMGRAVARAVKAALGMWEAA